MKIYPDLSMAIKGAGKYLVETHQVCESTTWQSVANSEPFAEASNFVFKAPIPSDQVTLLQLVKANMPWAEDHFLERVSGDPLNPPPSHEWWPFAQKSNDRFQSKKQFSHTYPERFWPKKAGEKKVTKNKGIRFDYGDLSDIVDLLVREPLTRQAYLPVWFPEDTGAHHGQRVPCTLGYHFIQRGGWLHCTYFIRSCDYLRHFSDDVYLAARLTQWIAEQVKQKGGFDWHPGFLNMHIVNLHVWVKEIPLLKKKLYCI